MNPDDIALIPLEHLRAAPWAKEPHPPLVNAIAKKFDPRLLGVLTVSKRSDTEFIVIDGRERWEALLRLGVPEAPCFVLRGLTEQREGEIYAEFSQRRQPLGEIHTNTTGAAMTYVLTCKCCDHTEDLGNARTAFEKGWDEPEHLPSWPVTCPLCPGVAALDPPLVDHSAAHEKWAREGRPAEFTQEGVRRL